MVCIMFVGFERFQPRKATSTAMTYCAPSTSRHKVSRHAVGYAAVHKGHILPVHRLKNAGNTYGGAYGAAEPARCEGHGAAGYKVGGCGAEGITHSSRFCALQRVSIYSSVFCRAARLYGGDLEVKNVRSDMEAQWTETHTYPRRRSIFRR